MVEYKHLVFTTHGTYRLWDKDIIECVELSHDKGLFVASILTDAQHAELEDYAETKLTDKQYESMREHFILPHGV